MDNFFCQEREREREFYFSRNHFENKYKFISQLF